MYLVQARCSDLSTPRSFSQMIKHLQEGAAIVLPDVPVNHTLQISGPFRFDTEREMETDKHQILDASTRRHIQLQTSCCAVATLRERNGKSRRWKCKQSDVFAGSSQTQSSKNYQDLAYHEMPPLISVARYQRPCCMFETFKNRHSWSRDVLIKTINVQLHPTLRLSSVHLTTMQPWSLT